MAEKMRLLVKMRAGQGAAPLALGGSAAGFSAAPLFRSVGRAQGLGAAADGVEWQLLTAREELRDANPWQACHDLVSAAAASGAPVEFAEPDLEQQWPLAREDIRGLSLAGGCGAPTDQNTSYPADPANPLWFRDAAHGQYDAALGGLPDPGAGRRVRVAHLDTGYDPNHKSLPAFLNRALQRNFADDGNPDDASDDTSGFFNNLGHGTGTLSILAGAGIGGGAPVGVAPFAEVVPLRVANRVVLFRNSAIARAFDYVHGLCAAPATRVQVITMSMGGVASQAWAEAVNALYEAGVFIVTAAGNNYANFPTREIVYPARFNRVVAACGVMRDGRPYADLSPLLMAGNYGPPEKMATAIAAYTPNTPWARLGCPGIVDSNGNGTSAATPQVAAAAALWIQKHRASYDAYSAPWMRVEAVRAALFGSAHFDAALESHLGKGRIAANDALAAAPALESALRMQKPDSAGFAFFKLLPGFGLDAAPGSRQAMLELEARQIMQQADFRDGVLAAVAANPQDPRAAARLADAFLAKSGLSRELRAALEGGAASGAAPGADLPGGKGGAAAAPAPAALPDPGAAHRLMAARDPAVPRPSKRMLRIFAFDPAASVDLDTFGVNIATVAVRWEDLKPGPVGDYIEVVDIDPASGCCYAPVDLDHPHLIAQDGLAPSEGQPQFHHQMVYAVAMRTIEHFERALGRTALWSSRHVRDAQGNVMREEYVRRLRIYPHAIRAANAYYSSDRKALLMGYFRARDTDAGSSLPGGRIFTALSHDIVAHETAHALLDGLHRRYQEPTNPDMLAFHEAFADIIAIFQHFTIPEALLDQVRRTRGDLEDESLLGQLAVQFGQATRGGYAALRNAIGFKNEMGVWQRAKPDRSDYLKAEEPHARGAVLVSAVFAAFAKLYRRRTADLIRLATGGTGVLPDGDIPHDLAERLTAEASKLAGHILGICIRALDYCPPVDLTFGDYLRALITADRDLVADDPHGYRVAFIAAFRERGIYPSSVQALSVESAVWERPPLELPKEGLDPFLKSLDLNWTPDSDREGAYNASKSNARLFYRWLSDPARAEIFSALGFKRADPKEILVYEDADGRAAQLEGNLRPVEVHSVRPARRTGPDGQSRSSLIAEITQTLRVGAERKRYRSGCTLIIDMQSAQAAYFIRKRMKTAVEQEMKFLGAAADGGEQNLRSNYFGLNSQRGEPFALLHGGH